LDGEARKNSSLYLILEEPLLLRLEDAFPLLFKTFTATSRSSLELEEEMASCTLMAFWR